mgnify:FL=1
MEGHTKVVFGRGCVKEYLASFVEEHGPNVLLAYGGGSVKRSGLYDEVFRILRRAGKQVVDLPDILPGPTYEKALGLPASLEGVAGAALERLKACAAACSLPPPSAASRWSPESCRRSSWRAAQPPPASPGPARRRYPHDRGPLAVPGACIQKREPGGKRPPAPPPGVKKKNF